MRSTHLLRLTITINLLLAAIIAWLGASAQAETFPNRADASLVVSGIPDRKGLAAQMGAGAAEHGVGLARITVGAAGETTMQAPPSAPPVENGPAEPVGIPGARAEPWSDSTSLRGRWAVWGEPAQLRAFYADLHHMGVDVSVRERADTGPRDLAASQADLMAALWVLGAAVLAAAALTAAEATRRVAVMEACGQSRRTAWWGLLGLVVAWMVGVLVVMLVAVALNPSTRAVLGSSVRGSVLGLLAWAALGVLAAAVVGLAAGFQWEAPLMERLRGRRPFLVIGLAASLAATAAMGLLPVAGVRALQTGMEQQRLSEELGVWDRMPQLASPSQYGAPDNESPEVGHRFRTAFTTLDKTTPIFLNAAPKPCDFADGGQGCLIVNKEYLRRLQPEVTLDGDGPWLVAPSGGDVGAVKGSVAEWMAFQGELSCGERQRAKGCVEVPSVQIVHAPAGVDGWPVLRQGNAVRSSGDDEATDPWVLVVDDGADWLSGNFLSAAMSRSELMFVGEPRKVEAALAASPVADRVSPAVDPQQTVEETRVELGRERHRAVVSMVVLAAIEITSLVVAVQVLTRARRRRLFVGFVTGRHPVRRHVPVAAVAAVMTLIGTVVALSRGVLEGPAGAWLLAGQCLVVALVVAVTATIVERGLNTTVLKEG